MKKITILRSDLDKCRGRAGIEITESTDPLLVNLEFSEYVKNHSILFRSTTSFLQNLRIPFDANVDNLTTQHYRVLDKETKMSYSQIGVHMVELNDIIRAYKNNTVGDFIERQLEYSDCISWQEQSIIQARKDKQREDLLKLPNAARETLVTAMYKKITSSLRLDEILSYSKDAHVQFLLDYGQEELN